VRRMDLDDQEFVLLSKILQGNEALFSALGVQRGPIWDALNEKLRSAMPPEPDPEPVVSLEGCTAEQLMAEVAKRMDAHQPVQPIHAEPAEELDDETRLLSRHRDCSEMKCLFETNPATKAECPHLIHVPVQTVAEPELAQPTATVEEYRAETDDLKTEVEWAALAPEELGKRTATLRDLLAKGLPTPVPITATPDVLALYGVDMEEVEACVRMPQRVEVRPESMDKRYATLAFFRGDMQVILGFRFPRQPGVMAVYLGSMLTHDSHHVEHMGGGGGSRTHRLPTTPKQLINRLKATGATVTTDTKSTSGAMLVTFRGQEIGRISGERMDRKQVQSDFNRMQRRMQAIARQEEGLAAS
jgi:hypothetical protein